MNIQHFGKSGRIDWETRRSIFVLAQVTAHAIRHLQQHPHNSRLDASRVQPATLMISKQLLTVSCPLTICTHKTSN